MKSEKTLTPLDMEQHKQWVTETFDKAASGYDSPALRYFPFCADRVVSWLRPHRGWKILDVATGTGAMAVALAQAVGPDGRVMGIDLSAAMLARAEHNINKMALQNVDLFEMDGEMPEFRADYFDAVSCAFGLFFMPDMLKALRQWQRVTKPGGQIVFTSFSESAFQPMVDMLVEDLRTVGADINVEAVSSASEQLKDEAACRALLAEADFSNVEARRFQLGYHLKDAQEWWEIVWHSALRGLVELLAGEEQAALQRRHLSRVETLCTEEGLWLDVEVILSSGHVAL